MSIKEILGSCLRFNAAIQQEPANSNRPQITVPSRKHKPELYLVNTEETLSLNFTECELDLLINMLSLYEEPGFISDFVLIGGNTSVLLVLKNPTTESVIEKGNILFNITKTVSANSPAQYGMHTALTAGIIGQTLNFRELIARLSNFMELYAPSGNAFKPEIAR